MSEKICDCRPGPAGCIHNWTPPVFGNVICAVLEHEWEPVVVATASAAPGPPSSWCRKCGLTVQATGVSIPLSAVQPFNTHVYIVDGQGVAVPFRIVRPAGTAG